MKALKDMKEIIEDEIKKIAKKGDISPQELDSVYKAVDVLKDIDELCRKEEMEKMGGEEGYSMDGGYSRNSYNSGYSRMMMPPYGQIWNRSMDGGMSNAGGSYNSYEGGMSNNYSGRGSYEGSYDYSNAGRRGRDGDGDGQYSERGSYDGSYESSYDGSYRRGRDARGRYTSRDGGSYNSGGGYSRHTEKERMVEMLEMMAGNAKDQSVKSTIEQAMQKLEQ